MLGRIRAALADGVPPPDVPRGYRESGSRAPAEAVALFVERLEETGAAVVRANDAGPAVSAALGGQGASRVVVAPDLPAAVRPAAIEVVEDNGLSPVELDGMDGAVTTCAAACAETGTIAFDGGEGQGRRAITLVPDLHVCVVRHEQVVETVPELFELLAPSAREGRPIVLVSGPSATSDIELVRVEGVHGPRRLVVVLTNP
jgi:L-lactate dehydrogenase complex protein LldG